MGKGKGEVDFWVDVIKKGQLIFEIHNLTNFEAKMIFLRLKKKLPKAVSIITT